MEGPNTRCAIKTEKKVHILLRTVTNQVEEEETGETKIRRGMKALASMNRHIGSVSAYPFSVAKGSRAKDRVSANRSLELIFS